MWRDYFGPTAHVVGIDINPACYSYAEKGIDIRIGSQSDPVFLQSVADEFGPFDIVLDDGGHTMEQQIVSFETLYHFVSQDGLYIVEDCHTSYHKEFGGSLLGPGTFIEFVKRKIDELQAYHIHQSPTTMTDITRLVRSIQIYDSVVAFCFEKINAPRIVQRGGSI